MSSRVWPLLPLLPFLLLAAACGSGGSGGTTGTPNGQCSYHDSGAAAARKVKLPPSNPPADLPGTLRFDTSAGQIRVTLEPEQAPCAVNSLVSLADQGYFDGTRCHRLTTQGAFVLQCGDPTGTGRGGPGYAFADELVPDDPRLQPCSTEAGQAYCTYNVGTVAMANAGPDTNGSQFFLVYGNSRFPPDYTVLGHLDAAGLKVVNEIAANGVDPATGTTDGAPKVPVTITGTKTG
ncbi:peptidyl-prolyl cis-trans isomerase B (cyclophilin B) [Marmoricola sp. URHA0025 HA25]